MKSTLNIALLGRDFRWNGGADFLRNIANALYSMQDIQPLKLFLMIPVKNQIDSFADLRRNVDKIARSILSLGKLAFPRRTVVLDGSIFDYFKNIEGEIEFVEYNADTGLIPTLKKINADVVFPVFHSLGGTFPFPWIGYIFDFQHKYFPDYFNSRQCLNRDISFATLLRDAKALLVNSKTVKADIDKFFPYHDCEIFNLPFSASPIVHWLELGHSDTLTRYKLPSRYFLISNQFWIHKSHYTAFRALALLLRNNAYADLHIVCTGKMDDPRFPEYITGLYDEIKTLGVDNKICLLGHIPKIDQIAIMKNCIAVLQPTLFEGGPGGGSIYDALSLGIPVIISDIPVNREIENEEDVAYFKVGVESDLADKMIKILEKNTRLPSKGELLDRGLKRKRMTGKKLLEAIDHVLRF
jgi:glycosyltransferase involved in cell wall biosynthesis